MASAEVKYAKPAEYQNWGRNRGFAAHGLRAWVLQNEVVLQGITSRGDASTAAELVVPITEIDNVIVALRSLK